MTKVSVQVANKPSIQELVRQYYQAWEENDQWAQPNLSDCLDFMVTEVAEAIDKRLRWNREYVRNHPSPWPITGGDVADEIFDAIMMGCIALDILGFDLMDVATKKLKHMDEKRQ